MHHYVYRIDRPSTGQFYIGIRSCSCWPTDDTRYLGSGTRIRRIPNEELRKTILVIVESREEAARIEKHLVRLDDPLSLNLCEGGSMGPIGCVRSEETRKKISEASSSRTHSNEAKRKISKALKGNSNTLGHSHTDETKAKMSTSHQESEKAKLSREKATNAWRGSRHTDEARRKISDARLGTHHSEETRRKMSEAQKAAWDRRRHPKS